MVECDLAKVEVAGSTPVSRSRNFDPRLGARVFDVAHLKRARSPSGKAEVCKTSIGGSIPPRASKFHPAIAWCAGPSLTLGISAAGSRSLRSLTPAKRLKFDSAPRLQTSRSPNT